MKKGQSPKWNLQSFTLEGIDESQPTRIEFVHNGKGRGRYVSVDDYPLWDGMRAEIDPDARR